MGLPGGASGKKPACQCRRCKRCRFDAWQEDPPEKGMATHSSILAWRIPWTEESAGLQSMGSQRVGCYEATNTHTHTHTHYTHEFTIVSKHLSCIHVKLLQPCPILCHLMDYSLPDSTVHGILQATILESYASPCSRGSWKPRDGTQVSCIEGGFFTV